MGFPVVECGREGQVVLSKPKDTGGLVSWATVAEQVTGLVVRYRQGSLSGIP